MPIDDVTRFNADCAQQPLWSRLGPLVVAHLSAMMDSVTMVVLVVLMVVLVVVKAGCPVRGAGKGS